MKQLNPPKVIDLGDFIYLWLFLPLITTSIIYPKDSPQILQEDRIQQDHRTVLLMTAEPSFDLADLRLTLPDNPRFISPFFTGIEKILSSMQSSLWSIPQSFVDLFRPLDAHSKLPAYIRSTAHDEICTQETVFLKKRFEITKAALEKVTQQELSPETAPRISLCFSGGGFRAMILTLGFLQGAAKTGLLDATTYMAALSGSSWALASLIASQKSIDTFLSELPAKIENGLDHIDDPNELANLSRILVGKLLSNQSISAMDLYGAVLANTLLKDLGNDRFHVTLSQTHQHLEDAHLPFPLYTAIATNPKRPVWIEVTPYELGSSAIGCYVPVWGYGRDFKDCCSTNLLCEQTLGYFMGIFGAAFELSLQDMMDRTAANMNAILSSLPAFIKEPLAQSLNLILASPLSSLRLFPSVLPNYSYQCGNHALTQEKEMCLIDAGLDFNVPLPPLLRKARELDVIIVYDCSSTINEGSELKLAQEYAQRNNIPFPAIDYTNIANKPISIFMDEDPTIPTIIYMPRIKHEDYHNGFDPDTCVDLDYCNTFNFTYSRENIQELSGLAAFTVEKHFDTIAKVLASVATRKQKTNPHRTIDLHQLEGISNTTQQTISI